MFRTDHRNRHHLWSTFFSILATISCQWSTGIPAGAQTLEAELLRTAPKELVAQALEQGDAARGAIVFFQPSLLCAQCHSVSGSVNGLGPNLANSVEPLSDEGLVEALVLPSKTIRAGFETVRVATADDTVLTGLLVERNEKQVTLREANGHVRTVLADEVEQLAVQSQSLMPAGQANQLASRQQFLDLLRYLIEIRDGGPERARELQPTQSLLTLKLADYEADIDHAGLIGDWNEQSLARGEAIYARVCANCHGTHTAIGSLPTAPRFAEAKLKNGSDPWSMYSTLTRGFGFMPAQTWMVPSQKYDVIHYLREEYLNRNSTVPATIVDDGYLAGLPVGKSRGPEPSEIEVWSAMDYGPSLTHTIQTPGEQLNIAYKGMAIRLDPGAGGVARGSQWMLFDCDTLRVAAAWQADEEQPSQRFIDWRGIQFDGQHGVHPSVVGKVSFANSNGPGWANPENDSFVDDQRVEGRDGRSYGPLPRQWAKFRGSYRHESQVILSYTVGSCEVLELPGIVANAEGDQPATFSRTFNFGPREQELILQVAEIGNGEEGNGEGLPLAYRIFPSDAQTSGLRVGVLPHTVPVTFSNLEGQLRMHIAAGNEPLRMVLWLSADGEVGNGEVGLLDSESRATIEADDGELDLLPLTRGWEDAVAGSAGDTVDAWRGCGAAGRRYAHAAPIESLAGANSPDGTRFLKRWSLGRLLVGWRCVVGED